MYFYRPFERTATDNEFIVTALQAFEELRTQLTPEILNELAVFTTLEIWNEPNITCTVLFYTLIHFQISYFKF